MGLLVSNLALVFFEGRRGRAAALKFITGGIGLRWRMVSPLRSLSHPLKASVYINSYYSGVDLWDTGDQARQLTGKYS